ncbi:hypothetical protein U3516DRAFT_529582, partial [Neocallimastix sp. 'constans']
YLLLHFFTALITNANTEDNNIDAQWMKCLNQNLTLNEINIPGTHDSGTYFIGRVLPFFPMAMNSRIAEYAKTQDLNIAEQLENGI